jgi:hypothetical protein
LNNYEDETTGRQAQPFHDMPKHKMTSPVNFHNAPATAFSKDGPMKGFEISDACPKS